MHKFTVEPLFLVLWAIAGIACTFLYIAFDRYKEGGLRKPTFGEIIIIVPLWPICLFVGIPYFFCVFATQQGYEVK